MSIQLQPFQYQPGLLVPSQLSDQLELMSDEVDLDKLNLIIGHNWRNSSKVVEQLRQLVTSAKVTRTTQGASTLEIVYEDIDLALLRSGAFGNTLLMIPDQGSLTQQGDALTANVDVEIDGLWFRLVSIDKPADTREVTLTFEDREVAVLRSYPKVSYNAADPNPQGYKLFAPSMTRIQVMQWLIQEAREYVQPDGTTGPRISSPMLQMSDSIAAALKVENAIGATAATNARAVAHTPGFVPTGPGTALTNPLKLNVLVKGVPATLDQIRNIDQILLTGYQLGFPENLLIAAVMTATDESDMSTAATNGTHVGLFQQDSTPGSVWVQLGGATRDPAKDATAFYKQAGKVYEQNPSQQLGQLCATTQRNPHPDVYQPYAAEAAVTVGIWKGNGETFGAPNNTVGGNTPAPAATKTAPAGGGVVGTATFARGSISNEGGRAVVTREDNWTCVQRLAQEVGWLCYCVSGTIYIDDWQHRLAQAPRIEFSDDSPGVNGVGVEIDTGMSMATATVDCRISRWGAPPGTVATITDMGPASGRWFVQTVERDLFSTAGTVTLQKPQLSLQEAAAETASPVQSVQILAPSGSGSASTAAAQRVIGTDQTGIRGRIVAAAQKALANRGNYPYAEVRPIPTSLFGTPPIVTDCSGFVTLCYKAAGAPDPNGPTYNYDGYGNTASLIANGSPTSSPKPGDLLFYNFTGRPWVGGTPSHVVLWVGDGTGTVVSQSDPSQGLNSYTVTAADLASSQVIGIYTYNLGIAG